MSHRSDNPARHLLSQRSGRLKISHLVRPHWKALAIGLLAVLGESLTDILEPWPIKIVVDYLLQSKKLPRWLSGTVSGLFGHDKLAILNFAVAAVAAIAVVGAVSSYVEKYLTTSVGQWVMHDLRRTLYNHVQRLSLAEHDEARTGDLITRVTSDIEAIQNFISSALLGMLVNVMTLVGMIGVMLYINWRFTLIALSIAPAHARRAPKFTGRIEFDHVPGYRERARMEKITKRIPRADAVWLGGRLAQLSDEQIRDCFPRRGLYAPGSRRFGNRS